MQLVIKSPVNPKIFPTLAMLLGAVAFVLGTTAAARETVNISDSVTTLPAYGSGWAYDSVACVLTIQDGADVLLTGSTSTRRVVAAAGARATVTLQNAAITSATASAFELQTYYYSTTDVTLVLAGSNTLKSTSATAAAGLAVEGGAKLTIKGDGSLTATGAYAAGIGGGSGQNAGTIVIQGGTVTAIGGYYAAGIGGGREQNAGAIVIQDGTVTATGGYYAAGIGGGFGADSGSVTINGGTVKATGGYLGAGIGGGHFSPDDRRYSSGTIVINGGSVLAQAGASEGVSDSNGCFSAAGIGSGCFGSPGSITINGGSVISYGGTFGAGIGAGSGAGYAGSITINGGVVTAYTEGGATARSGYDRCGGAAAIGGGGCAVWNRSIYSKCPAGTITIRGGVVVALVSYTNTSPAIGGGPGATSGSINITGGTVIARGHIGIAPARTIYLYYYYDSGIIFGIGAKEYYTTFPFPYGWTKTTINNSYGAANNAVVFTTAAQIDNGSVVSNGNGKFLDSTGVIIDGSTLALTTNLVLPATADLTIPAGWTLSNPSPRIFENHGALIVLGTLANAGALNNAGDIVMHGALTNTGAFNNLAGGAILIPVEVRGLSAVSREANGSREVALAGTPVLYPASPTITGISLERPPLTATSLDPVSCATGAVADAAAGVDKPVTTNLKLTGNLGNYYLLLQPDDITVTITASTGGNGNNNGNNSGGTGGNGNNSGGGNNNNSSGGAGGGSGGGGATSAPALMLLAVLAALRAARRK